MAARVGKDPAESSNMHLPARGGAVLLALALVSCASYHPQPLHPQASVRAFAARSLDSPVLAKAVAPLLPPSTAAGWPPDTWDRGSLLAVALIDNPQLAIARAQVSATLAHEITAAENPNPTLGLQAEYALHDIKPWLYGISLDLPLRSPTQKRLEIDLSRLATSNARWQLMNQTWAVRQQLVTALSDRESAQQRLQLLTKLLGDQKRLSSLEQQRLDAGEDGPDTLATVQDALLQASHQQSRARADVAAAQAATATALGLPPQALDHLKFDWPDWGDPPVANTARLREARDQALLSRADLSAAIGDYAAAEHTLQLAIAKQYPQFSLSPGYYWDHGVHKFPLGVNLSLPIFNQNQGEIAEARAGRTLAARRMLALQADIYDQIATAERAEAIARDNLRIADQQFASAQQQKQRAARGLRLGAVDSGVKLASEIAITRAALEQLDAHQQLQSARIALENALHAPLSGPELALSRSPASLKNSAAGDSP